MTAAARTHNRFSPGRTLRFAMVLLGHLAVLLGLLRPGAPAPEPARASVTEHDALRVRWLAKAVPQRTSVPRITAAARRRAATRLTPFPAPQRQDAAAPPTPLRSTATAQAPPATPAYVPGGRGFAENLRSQAAATPPLPGALVPGAPRFRMVDPRSQGLAGVVRLIGGLAGAVDPHCLDVDAWQGMTDEERVAHHVAARDIERLADEYGCKRR